MATLLGFHKNTLVNYERGGRLPDVDFLAVVAAKTEADFLDLVRLRLEVSEWAEARAQARVLKRWSDQSGSAGIDSPSVMDSWEVTFPICSMGGRADQSGANSAVESYDREAGTDWIRAELAPADQRLCLYRITGSSFDPTLRDGDLVLVDRVSVMAEHEGIYLLQLHEGLLVKRLQILPQGKLRFSSDNPAYHAFELRRDELTDGQITIMGRVVRVLSKL
ncbi:S24 family peptidase [Methylocaldum sp.]|uniref:S24 family peptidase n=1 Tax=Methylocaldum sp. TaxID=1969727 RepID=UPI00321F825F